jgi:hypothetical protein
MLASAGLSGAGGAAGGASAGRSAMLNKAGQYAANAKMNQQFGPKAGQYAGQTRGLNQAFGPTLETRRKDEERKDAKRTEAMLRERMLSALKKGTVGLLGLAIATPKLTKMFSNAQLAMISSLREYNASIAKTLNLLEFHRFQRDIQMAAAISTTSRFAAQSRDVREQSTQPFREYSQNMKNAFAGFGDRFVAALADSTKVMFPVTRAIIDATNKYLREADVGRVETLWGKELRIMGDRKSREDLARRRANGDDTWNDRERDDI